MLTGATGAPGAVFDFLLMSSDCTMVSPTFSSSDGYFCYSILISSRAFNGKCKIGSHHQTSSFEQARP